IFVQVRSQQSFFRLARSCLRTSRRNRDWDAEGNKKVAARTKLLRARSQVGYSLVRQRNGHSHSASHPTFGGCPGRCTLKAIAANRYGGGATARPRCFAEHGARVHPRKAVASHHLTGSILQRLLCEILSRHRECDILRHLSRRELRGEGSSA